MNRIYHYYNKKKKRKRERSEYEFDSSSVGDLAFLLLIFFIVTSSFILRQGIFMSLPSKTAGSKKVTEDQMINIYPTNKSFMIDGQEISRDDLIKRLIKEITNNKEIITVINMMEDVKYDRLVDALSVSKESGIKEISLKSLIKEEL